MCSLNTTVWLWLGLYGHWLRPQADPTAVMGSLRPVPAILLAQIRVDPCQWMRPRKGVRIQHTNPTPLPCPIYLPCLVTAPFHPSLLHSTPFLPTPAPLHPLNRFTSTSGSLLICWHTWEGSDLRCCKVLYGWFTTPCTSRTHILPAHTLDRIGPCEKYCII